MKKNTLLYLLLAAGVYYLIYRQIKLGKQAKGGKRPYTLEVAEAEKITEQEFKTPSLLKKIAPVAKKIVEKAKAKRAAKKKVGYFPETF